MKKILFVLIFLLCINVKASIVLMDADSGRILYSKAATEKKLIASTTKIMTSIIALENSTLEKKIIIGKETREVNGSMIYAKEGEVFTLNDLLHGLMLQSGNDAAMTIATNVLGYDNFIKEMNLKAIKLGMKNTTFENPHGLNDNSKNISTAEDMSKLMRYAIKNKEFLNITSSKIYKVDKYIWPNKNKLLKQYKYLISGKIGYTKASGQVFVSAAKKDGKTLIITSIDESDKFNLHKKLYEKYFEAYEKYKILDMNTFSFKVKNKNKYHYYIDNDYYMLLKKDEINKLKIKIDLSKNEEKVTIILNNKIIDNVKLKKIKYEVKTNKIKQILSFWK
ncbi:MAG: serine hydrolase [Tenericutes bacterium]|nr:serine hydrolase [Mycoplasmatota bacterium]